MLDSDDEDENPKKKPVDESDDEDEKPKKKSSDDSDDEDKKSKSKEKELISFEEERTEIMFNNDFKRIILNHTFAIKFKDIINFIEDKNLLIKNNFDIAHKANNVLLQNILVDSIKKQIGI